MKRTFWRTELSKVEPGKILIRGYRIEDLIQKCSFGEMVYLIFTGNLPNKNEGGMIEAILVSSVDHSFLAPSADATRFVASSGVPLQASVAAGILALGDIHGGVIEECAKILQEKLKEIPSPNYRNIAIEIVTEHRKAKKRIPGYGHPIHNPDPRAVKLLTIARELKISDRNVKLTEAITVAIKNIVGKDLPLNVDGAIAAVISDMGIDWRLGKGFFIISRSVGLIAHTFEQMTKEKPFKVVPWEEIEYFGSQEREIPSSYYQRS